jgi:class 3 adenylate cyclase
MRVVETFYMAPIGLFIFFFAQAFLLSRRFALAFNTAETLTLELEQKVLDRTKELDNARLQSDKLLENILPEAVAKELKEKGSVTPQYYPAVTVIFIDFVDFTKQSENWDPKELVSELDFCFRAFDEIIDKYSIEKLKTIGDCYMAASGVPVFQPDHAFQVCEAALQISGFLESHRRKQERSGRIPWGYRIGINSGSVVAGVIGTHKFVYDIWGDTVNVASRMENHAEPGEINISQATYEIIKDQFECQMKGATEVKGKGSMNMYCLKSRKLK